MDENRAGLKPAAEELGGVGPHLGLKRLIAYRQGTLPAAEREKVQEHLSRCPRCSDFLLELRDFEAAVAGGEAGPESLRQEDWDSLARRLPETTPVVRPIAGAARKAQQRRRLPSLRVGVAAALLLAVIGLALWAAVTVRQERQRLTRLEQRLEEREAALVALRSALAKTERELAAARRQIRDRDQPAGREDELAARVAELTSELEELRRTTRTPERREQIAAASTVEVSVAPRFVLRGQEPPENVSLRGGGVVNPVRRPLRQDRFTVALSLAGQPVYEEYRLELMDRHGKVLWAGRRPGTSLLGDDGTSVSFDGLGAGLYRLRIEGLHPDRRELLAEYLLQVEP